MKMDRLVIPPTKENVWVNRIVKIIFVIEDFNNN
jgi:hypothetical protein